MNIQGAWLCVKLKMRQILDFAMPRHERTAIFSSGNLERFLKRRPKQAKMRSEDKFKINPSWSKINGLQHKKNPIKNGKTTDTAILSGHPPTKPSKRLQKRICNCNFREMEQEICITKARIKRRKFTKNRISEHKAPRNREKPAKWRRWKAKDREKGRKA